MIKQHNKWEILESEKRGLHLQLTNMKDNVQITRGFLQHAFGGTLRISKAWRVRKLNLARPM